MITYCSISDVKSMKLHSISIEIFTIKYCLRRPNYALVSRHLKGENRVPLHSYSPYIYIYILRGKRVWGTLFSNIKGENSGENSVPLHSFPPYIKGKNCVPYTLFIHLLPYMHVRKYTRSTAS